MFEKIEVSPQRFRNVSRSLTFPNGIAAHEPFGHPLFAAHRTTAPAVAGLAGFALLFTACHLYFAARIGLTNDEAYYRLWAMHPALSYFDHPPMVAWMVATGRWLAGDTPLGIRFGAAILYVVAGLALFRTASLLYGTKLAIASCWIALAMPLLAVGGIIASPDAPSVLFWNLTVWAVAEFWRSQNPRWWLAVGVFAGCGLLSKYTNLFLGASILIWLTAVPGNAKSLRLPQFWLGGLIAAALFMPVVIWNYHHDWASFAMQFGRVTESSARFGHFEFLMIGTYLGLASPVVASLAIAGLAGTARAAYAQRRSQDVLLCSVILPALAYFLIHALHARVHFNWMAPIYPFLAISAAWGLDLYVPKQWRRRSVFLGALGVGFLSTAAIFAHALKPMSTSRDFDILGETRGWSTFAAAVDAIRQHEHAAWIATSTFATNAQLAFALGEGTAVAQLNDPIRYVDMPALEPGITNRPALYVERAERSDLPLLQMKFANITQLGSISRADGTAAGWSYNVYLVSGPKRLPSKELHR
jgi:4-amino-4-deoxy-L-arabinose transferase-like glycosyltransferase